MSNRAQDREAMPVLVGFQPVREALRRRPEAVAEVLIARKLKGKRVQEVEALSRSHALEIRWVPKTELDAICEGAAHNGFGLVLRHAAPTNAESSDRQLAVLLEDVEDPRNLGALLRVCEGSGVGNVLVRDRGSAPLNATVAKTSAGASEWLPVERFTNSAQKITALQKEGFWIYGATEGGSAPWEIDLTGKVVLCFGGEGNGLRERTRKLCDGLVGLPMRGRIESLNVATAAAAILYEAVRQRTSAVDQV